MSRLTWQHPGFGGFSIPQAPLASASCTESLLCGPSSVEIFALLSVQAASLSPPPATLISPLLLCSSREEGLEPQVQVWPCQQQGTLWQGKAERGISDLGQVQTLGCSLCLADFLELIRVWSLMDAFISLAAPFLLWEGLSLGEGRFLVEKGSPVYFTVDIGNKPTNPELSVYRSLLHPFPAPNTDSWPHPAG